MPKIAIVLGSIRPGRKAEIVGRWVHEHATGRQDATFELVDLAAYALPHLDESTPPIMGAYEQPHTTIADDRVTADEKQHQTLDRMLDELIAWAGALEPLRDS